MSDTAKLFFALLITWGFIAAWLLYSHFKIRNEENKHE
jgi:hypothetical protein